MKKKSPTTPNGIDRRDFLKQFALISIASLGTAVTGCSSGDDPVVVPLYGPEPVVLYGPPPNAGPEVENIYYLLPDGSEVVLDDSQDVDIDAEFNIYFTDPMQEASQDAVVLKDGEDQPVRLNFRWDTEFTVLKVTPEASLQTAAMYTLLVDETAQDADGSPIQLTDYAQATFKTAAA